MLLTIPLGVKTRSVNMLQKKQLYLQGYPKGVPYLTLHKHRVQEKIMYTSKLSIYHPSYLFIQRIVLFRSSFISASCALTFNFVINFSYSKNHSKNHASIFTRSIWFINFVHSFDTRTSHTNSRFQSVIEDSQFRTQFGTQIRDFNLSTRIVKIASF